MNKAKPVINNKEATELFKDDLADLKIPKINW